MGSSITFFTPINHLIVNIYTVKGFLILSSAVFVLFQIQFYFAAIKLMLVNVVKFDLRLISGCLFLLWMWMQYVVKKHGESAVIKYHDNMSALQSPNKMKLS